MVSDHPKEEYLCTELGVAPEHFQVRSPPPQRKQNKIKVVFDKMLLRKDI